MRPLVLQAQQEDISQPEMSWMQLLPTDLVQEKGCPPPPRRPAGQSGSQVYGVRLCQGPALGLPGPRRCRGVSELRVYLPTQFRRLLPYRYALPDHICLFLLARAESTAVSPLFTVCVTLSGEQVGCEADGEAGQGQGQPLLPPHPRHWRPDSPPGGICAHRGRACATPPRRPRRRRRPTRSEGCEKPRTVTRLEHCGRCAGAARTAACARAVVSFSSSGGGPQASSPCPPPPPRTRRSGRSAGARSNRVGQQRQVHRRPWAGTPSSVWRVPALPCPALHLSPLSSKPLPSPPSPQALRFVPGTSIRLLPVSIPFPVHWPLSLESLHPNRTKTKTKPLP